LKHFVEHFDCAPISDFEVKFGEICEPVSLSDECVGKSSQCSF